MKIRFAYGIAMALLSAGFSTVTLAHHSRAMFEESKTVTLKGVVKEWQYTNPHSWLLVEVTNADGTKTTWGFEAEGPTTLMRGGLKKSDIPVGTKLTITGNPMKDGTPRAAWIKAVTDEGKELNPARGFVVK